jgi:starch synthase
VPDHPADAGQVEVIKVLSVASEIFPLVKTGGLADVVGALPGALKACGVQMASFVPGYPAVMAALKDAKGVHNYSNLYGAPAAIVHGTAHGLEIFALDAQHLFSRPGNPYLGPDGKDWPDNPQRYAALSRAASDFGEGKIKAFVPDILHLHDWQAALAAVNVRYAAEGVRRPKTLMTVHNIAFQGTYAATLFASLGLPPQANMMESLEYYGNISYLKGGLASADALSTVSPTYAHEITTPEFGMGLDGLLRARRSVLHGIVNGIDTDVWNPETDKDIAQPYSLKSLSKRGANKRALEKRLGLHEGDGILHGVVSRLTWQKGLDLLAEHLDWLVQSGARLALVGTGEAGIEAAFRDAAEKHKGRIGLSMKYDEALSHLVQAGSDTMLVPSRFEPCGLTQLYGLRYGCVPVVGRTGGLADTVIDANDAALGSGVATGIQLSPITSANLQAALERSAQLHSQSKVWSAIQARGMAQDVSWDRSAAKYAELYRSLLSH